MYKLNVARWFIFGFWMGICFVWLFLAFIFNDDPSAQAKLYPFLQGFSFSTFAVAIALALLASKVKKHQQQQQKALEAPSLVSS